MFRDYELIVEYKQAGIPLDALAYTKAFERLVLNLGVPATDVNKRRVYRQLIEMRQKGVLPRVWP